MTWVQSWVGELLIKSCKLQGMAEKEKKIRRRSKGSINPSDLAQGGRSSAKTGVLQFMG